MLRAAPLAWLGYASTALACPVCFAAKNEASRQAFVRATAFMTALPLLLMTGLGLWAWLRLRQLTSEDRGAVHDAPRIEPAAAGALGIQRENSPQRPAERATVRATEYPTPQRPPGHALGAAE